MGMKKIETSIQKELIKYIRVTYPQVDIRYNKSENKRDILQAVEDKRMGQAIAGTPDLTLFYHKEDFTYILELELKKKDGKLNYAQITWWKNFKQNKNRQGKVAYGYLEAKEIVDNWVKSII